MRQRAAAKVLLGAALAVLATAGCQQAPPQEGSAARAVDKVLEEAVASQPAADSTPSAVEAALLPKIDIDLAPSRRDLGQRFDISVTESPARDFFMSLVDGTPYNMVVHPGVEGDVTLKLKAVTIPDVMDIVRNVYGYEFRDTRYGYEVLPARMRSRVYHVDYPNIKRSGRSETRVSSGQITDAATASNASDSTEQDGDSTTTASAVSGTRINTEQPETSFWTELDTSLKAIVGAESGRAVVVNPQAGVVVVRAMPQELREVEEFLEKTQAIARRQVILEAKILEVQLSDNYRQGINWGALLNINNHPISFGQTGGGSILGPGSGDRFTPGERFNVSDLATPNANAGDLNPANAALGTLANVTASAFGGMFAAAFALGDFNAFIELLETQGIVHVLSSPRISTMNNQKAVIKVGSDEFFVTDVSTTTVASTTAVTTPNVELTPFFEGIALDVTPQISEAGNVVLHVHPTVSVVTDDLKNIPVGTTIQQLTLARSTVRESDSIIRAASGQVVVIGGLMENKGADDEAGTPVLDDLPGVGTLFRHKSESSLKTELVILLRPVVADSGPGWSDAMAESAQRIRDMNEVVTRRDEARDLRLPEPLPQ
jgi:MSHA biogenesis protein MshL